MSENTMDPETRIIEAANKVFLKNGVSGTTMSQIADEANISRTSLHYYFRNKTRLFQKVLDTIRDRVIPTLSEIINAEVPVISKIEMFVNEYIDLIMNNPMIPGFLFMEMQRDANWIVELFRTQNLNFDKLTAQIEQEITDGKIKPFRLEDLYANIMGMSVFPLLAKPVFMEFMFDHNEKEFYNFMTSRKKIIMSVIDNWLTPC
jgi:TetR/AcrR family transcriptional regulator